MSSTEIKDLKAGIHKLKKSGIRHKNTDKALRDNEAFYSALFQNNPIQTVVVDLKGRVIAYNKQKKMSGDRLPRIGDVMYRDYASKHQIDMYSELMKCIKNREMREYPELKYERKILNIKIAPFKNGAIITSIDITGSKKTEEELRISELRYRTLQNNIPIGIYRISAGGKFISGNPALIDMLGYKKERELLGMKVLRLHHSAKKRKELVKILLRNAKVDNFECQIICKNGSTMWQSLSVKTVRGESGEVLHYDGVARNINERKKAEQDLFRITKAFEGTSEAILISESEGNNFYQNKAFYEMFEFTNYELGAAGGASVLYKDKNVVQEIFKTILKGKSWSGIVDMVSKSGREMIISLRADAVKDEDGKTIGLVGVHSDITEYMKLREEGRKLQAQMQHGQKLESLGVLAGGIAHDFNNLLLGILGNADLALLEITPASPAAKNIIDIVSITRRAAELCRQMLAYSGKGRFIIEPINLSELVHETVNLLKVSISKTAALKYNLSENLPFLKADATQIRQIVMNLVTNASDAINGKSGIISITTGEMECDGQYLDQNIFKEDLVEGKYIFIEVADTGCGMDEKTKEKMFDPFFTTKLHGRGLGLAAVMGIIRSHGGACRVDSEIGKGTTFRILFPVSPKFPLKTDKENNEGAAVQ